MKICLAGSSAVTEVNRKEFEKVPYILESFYTFKDWQKPLIKKADLFLLDSGAFSFLNSGKKNINWQEYIDKYCDFIIENDVKYFFELDIDAIVGYEKVKEIRKYIETRTGKKCIPVWHRERGKEDFIQMCKDYDYVAIGGLVGMGYSKKHWKYFPWFIKTAHENGAKIHALGFTALSGLKKYHFDTVDSTSWKSGNRFGTLYQFKNGDMVQLKKKPNKRLVSGERYSEVEKFVLDEWIKYQKYADKFY